MQDLRQFHSDYRSVPAGKVVGAAVVAAVIAVLGFFAYRNGMLTPGPRQVVSNSELPSPGPVKPVAPRQAPPAPM